MESILLLPKKTPFSPLKGKKIVNKDTPLVGSTSSDPNLLGLFFSWYGSPNKGNKDHIVNLNENEYPVEESEDEGDRAARDKGSDCELPPESDHEGVVKNANKEEEEEGIGRLFEIESSTGETEEKNEKLVIEEEIEITYYDEWSYSYDEEYENEPDYHYNGEEEDEAWDNFMYHRKNSLNPGLLRDSRDYKKEKMNRRWIKAYEQNKRDLKSSVISSYVSARSSCASYSNYGYQRGSVVPSTTTNSSRRNPPNPYQGQTTQEIDALNRAIIESAAEFARSTNVGLSANQLQDLLTRDLTPEDYELLLMLDQSTKPKTVETNVLTSFPSIEITDENSEKYVADKCAVCQCEYEVGDTLNSLPCGHHFHKDCIHQWLSSSSQKCPVDNLPVVQS